MRRCGSSRVQVYSSGVGRLGLLALQLVDHVQRYGADNFQTPGAEFIHGVFVGVPRRIVEVDNIDGGDTHLDEGHVIVVGGDGLVGKVGLIAELGGGAPEKLSQERGGIGFLPDIQ